MLRSYYSESIEKFINSDINSILGILAQNSGNILDQMHAWRQQIVILREILFNQKGRILFEYAIPRMGSRVDVVLLIENVVFVIEFKVGEKEYNSSAINQVWDYTLDLKSFHEKSELPLLVPILVATDAKSLKLEIESTNHNDNTIKPLKANRDNLGSYINLVLNWAKDFPILDIDGWENGKYYPTPTIIQKASDLYCKNTVEGLTEKSSDEQNFTDTTKAISEIILQTNKNQEKAICFITGVPGAGKTLVGLEIASKHLNADRRESSVYLSGNGPLVKVLQEALAMDHVAAKNILNQKITKSEARSKVKLFIQNVHHFRDWGLKDNRPQPEHIAIFDEAQRAWNLKQTVDFMRRKKNIQDFNESEPEFLISCMDRHSDWAVVLCLVGGGQEINTGEAGISEWINAVNHRFKNWKIYISSRLTDEEYAAGNAISLFENKEKLIVNNALHLSVSMRSFRAENVSAFVKKLLDIDIINASLLYKEFCDKFPIVLTRDINKAKNWLLSMARGSQRYGMVVSSKAQRLKPFAIDVRYETDPVHWFLYSKDDVRSSYYLEDVATEFQVQGLELDWVCVTWDADFRFNENAWEHKNFKGNRWENIKSQTIKDFQKNAYRVLLTRARQGMIICVPEGNIDDHTRRPEFYNPTYNYLKEIGIMEI